MLYQKSYDPSIAVHKDPVEAFVPAVGIMCSALPPVISQQFQARCFPEDIFHFQVEFKVLSWCPVLIMKNNSDHGGKNVSVFHKQHYSRAELICKEDTAPRVIPANAHMLSLV